MNGSVAFEDVVQLIWTFVTITFVFAFLEDVAYKFLLLKLDKLAQFLRFDKDKSITSM